MFLSNLMKQDEAKFMALKEDDYFNYFFDDFKDLALSMFEWENLPIGTDEEFIERVLFEHGTVGFVDDGDTGSVLSLKASKVGEPNMYGKPLKYRLSSANGGVHDKEYDAEDVIILRNDKLNQPTIDRLLVSCTRLANISMTIDMNVEAQKTPLIIEADEDSINSAKTFVDKWKRNAFTMFVRKGVNNLSPHENFKAHKTDAPYVADKLLQLQHDIKNDTLTRIGINNTDVTKRERMITDEVNANVMEIMGHAQSMLSERQKACDLINEKWGSETRVKLRNENMFIFSQEESEEGESNESFYTPN